MVIVPALPGVGEVMGVLVLEIMGWKKGLVFAGSAVSVPTFKVIFPAGPAPLVSAKIPVTRRTGASDNKLTVFAVTVMLAGVFVALPPLFVVEIALLSRLTLVAALPGPWSP